MNPVVGLDVSKGESQVQAFLDKGKPYRQSFKVSHTVEGLRSLVVFLEEVKNESGKNPRAGLTLAEDNSVFDTIKKTRFVLDLV